MAKLVTGNDKRFADWVTDRFGLDPNKVLGATIKILPGHVVTIQVDIDLTEEDLQLLFAERASSSVTSFEAQKQEPGGLG